MMQAPPNLSSSESLEGQSSPSGSADKTFYDDIETSTSVDQAERLPAQYWRYITRTRACLEQHFRGRGGCVSIEFGAGSCSLSLALSDMPCMVRLVCSDISSERMRALAPGAARGVPAARLEKISYHEGDFNERLPFDDHSFDAVLFDAALHHAGSPWFTLGECRRVLKPDGLLIAQREQYLAHLTQGIAIRRLLASTEVRSGVIENTYFRSQYEYFLRARGFEPVFHSVPDALWQRGLFFLNGLVFSKWVIAARPLRGPVPYESNGLAVRL